MLLYHGSNIDIKEIDLTFENMLSGMIYKKTTNQYSFHTEKAIALLKKVGV